MQSTNAHAPRPFSRRSWWNNATPALICLALLVVGTQTGQAQKGNEGKGTTRVAIDRRAAIASDASIRISGAISSLRIIGWDRDSLAITGTMPQGWRFDGGVASGVVGLG